MAVRKNADGSITVGILDERKSVEEKPVDEKPKRTRKAKENGEE